MDDNNNLGISVHAGFPNPAAHSLLGSLNLQQLLITHPISTFFMRIQGNAWEDQGIFNDDIAVVDRSIEPHRSDLMIWWQGDSFFISRLTAQPQETQAWGVITAVIHQYKR